MGLIYRCCDEATYLDEALALAKRLATQPTRGLGLIKRALNQSLGNDLDTQLELERELQTEAGNSDDYQEGVNAFLEKRKPQYKGT
jgi:2-(1,2-epoxy-1,2-dihydrophenyl)acetyl-CoA isomerase